MHTELVRAVTDDGMRLHGALHVPAVPGAWAIICVHGAGSNFYASSLLADLTPSLHSLGLAVLRINTRGHDGVYTTTNRDGLCFQGGGFEIVDECRLDMQAWCQFLREREFHKVLLLGHSLGAIKCVYAQAFAPSALVQGVIAVSPPSLAYCRFQTNSQFQRDLAQATDDIQSENAQRLRKFLFPIPMIASAATFVDKYGPEARYDILQFLERVSVPQFFVYGSQELTDGGPAFHGIVEQVRCAAVDSQDVVIQTVADADHFYRGKAEQLGAIIQEWIRERGLQQ